MYTIISATNRADSFTLKVSNQYQLFFKEQGIDAKVLSLEALRSLERDDIYQQIEDEILTPSQKFIFVMPEYNGSFPGIFKLMMDISNLSLCWNDKKVMLVGVSDGKAGNLRGIDTMTNMCHYMKMDVYFQKLPISSIRSLFSNDTFIDEKMILTIKNQIKGFINY